MLGRRNCKVCQVSDEAEPHTQALGETTALNRAGAGFLEGDGIVEIRVAAAHGLTWTG